MPPVGRPLRVAHVSTVDLTQRFLLLGQLRRLREEGFEVTSISAPGPWAKDLVAEGFRFLPWPHATRAWDLPSDARAFRELVGLLRKERFDLVHLHNPKPGLLGRLAGRLVHVPCVVNTVHGFYALPEDPLPKRALVLGLEWVAARCSDLELYQSEEDLRWARRLGVVDRRSSAFLGNGADLTRFDPGRIDPERTRRLRADLGFPSEAPVVGTVGRLVAEKGYREFFRAAAAIARVSPEVRFLAIGGPDPRKRDALTERELAQRADLITFVGWRDDLPDLLALMDVFVLASWREGVPRSVIEAASMGKPVVATDIRGCREVVRNGVEGFLVPPRDARRLTEAMRRLVDDPTLRQRFGAAARVRATDRFDERAVADRLLLHYRRLLDRKGMLGRAVGEITVRRARPEDVPALTGLHREIPFAFLASLGGAFMRRLYRALVADREAAVLVAVSGTNRVVGFATGVVSVRGFYRRFYARHGLQAAVAAAPALLRRGVLRRMLETASYPSASAALPDAELLSIAVAPGWRGRAVGSVLAEGIVNALRAEGAEAVKVLVRQENTRANRFYDRLGFRRAGQVMLHDGRPNVVWVANGPQPNAGSGEG